MYSLITPPGAEPIDLTSLKNQLRIDHDNDDALLLALQATARTYIERRLDLAVMSQTWRVILPPGQRCIRLRPTPVQTIVQVYYSVEDVIVYLSSQDWELEPVHKSSVEILANMPSEAESVSVEFLSGYQSLEDVPADIVRAVSLLTAHYYEEREVFRNERYIPVPYGVDALLQPYRRVSL